MIAALSVPLVRYIGIRNIYTSIHVENLKWSGPMEYYFLKCTVAYNRHNKSYRL